MKLHPALWKTATVVVPSLLTGWWVGSQVQIQTALAFAIGAFYGAVAGASLLLYLWLRKKIGTFTAVAAIGLIGAVAFAVFSMIPSDCPGYYTFEGRCTNQAVAVYALLGALSPVLVALLALPVYLAIKGFAWLYRFSFSKDASGRSSLSRLLERFSKKQAPSSQKKKPTSKDESAKGKPSGKGRPTPKRPRPVRN